MAKNAKPGTGVSSEMDEVLNELEEEGIDLEAQDEKDDSQSKDEKSEDQQGEDDAGSESKESKEESKEEESEESEDESEETEEDEESEESEDGDESDDDVKLPEKSVPIGKLNYWKDKAKKALKDLAELKDSSSQKEVDEKLQKISEDEGIPMERLQTLVDAISSKVIAPELKKKIEMAAQYQEKVASEEFQNNSFASEFEASVKPIILNENPEITQTEYDKIVEEVYSKAFVPNKDNTIDPKTGRAPKSLVDIYFSSKKPQRKFGGEKTKVKSIAGENSKSFDDINSPEDVENMSDEDFEKGFNDSKKASPKMIGKRLVK